MSSYDAEINMAEARIAELGQRMEPVAVRLVDEIASFVSNWIDESARGLAKENPERIKSLGEDGVKELRQELDQARAQIRGSADDAFARVLVHRQANWKASKSQFDDGPKVLNYGERMSDDVCNGIVRLIAPSAKLLDEAGILRRSDWTRFYANPPEHTMNVLAEYQDMLDQYAKQDRGRQAAIRAKDESEAASMWDEAGD